MCSKCVYISDLYEFGLLGIYTNHVIKKEIGSLSTGRRWKEV